MANRSKVSFGASVNTARQKHYREHFPECWSEIPKRGGAPPAQDSKGSTIASSGSFTATCTCISKFVNPTRAN